MTVIVNYTSAALRAGFERPNSLNFMLNIKFNTRDGRTFHKKEVSRFLLT